jgi:hypothetical protein
VFEIETTQDLERRLREFTLLYNSECDAKHPRPVKELVVEVHLVEQNKALAAKRDSTPVNADSQSASFQKLVEQARSSLELKRQTTGSNSSQSESSDGLTQQISIAENKRDEIDVVASEAIPFAFEESSEPTPIDWNAHQSGVLVDASGTIDLVLESPGDAAQSSGDVDKDNKNIRSLYQMDTNDLNHSTPTTPSSIQIALQTTTPKRVFGSGFSSPQTETSQQASPSTVAALQQLDPHLFDADMFE